MASAQPPSKPGPVLARLLSDPTYYHLAPLESKVAVEIALAEEKVAMFRDGNNGLRVVDKGVLDPDSLAGLPLVKKKEHTRLWHVLYDGDGDEWKGMVKIVYAFAHVEGEEKGKGMNALVKVLERELEGLKAAGRLRDGMAFSVAQMGTQIAFMEFTR